MAAASAELAVAVSHPGLRKATREDRKWPVTWVGVAGFEPAASSSRTKRAAKLRYAPPPETARTPGRLCPGTPGSLADARNQREQGCFRPAGEPERCPG